MTINSFFIATGKEIQDQYLTKKNIHLFNIIYTLKKFMGKVQTLKKVQFFNVRYVTQNFIRRFFSI